ncbi:U-box domain-containing protein 35-like [Cornus florida]|uniref:U-box domain-containing protein 35-like n=1 Tax=Cornus florida TaxID=4283 RepID=UPI00289DD5B5|nr:U-box domain-containing protein 35-like [Cornus florida]
MLNPRVNGENSVVVAVDKDKGSQNALKWAVDHLLFKGQTVILLHVNQTPSSISSQSKSDCITFLNYGSPMSQSSRAAGCITNRHEPDRQTMELFLPFRCFCSLREVASDKCFILKIFLFNGHVHCEDVILEDQDIAKALVEFVSYNRISTLLLGAPSRNGISRLFKTDIPSTVLRGAPHFCNVYVISKRKIASSRSASRPVPSNSIRQRMHFGHNNHNHETDYMSGTTNSRMHDEVTVPDTDISFVSSGRISTDSMFFAFYDNLGSEQTSEMTHRSSKSLSVWDKSHDPLCLGSKLGCFDSADEVTRMRLESGRTSSSLHSIQELEEKMRRLERQMKQTMDMYLAACKEALEAKEKAREHQLRNTEYEKRLEEAQKAKEEALVVAEMEKERAKAAIEAAHAVCRKAEQEAQKKVNAEMKAPKESEDKMTTLDSLGGSPVVRKYQSLLHITVVVFIFYLYFIVLVLLTATAALSPFRIAFAQMRSTSMGGRKWSKENGETTIQNVAVGVDKDKGSQAALKWAIDNLVEKGQSLTLIHVNQRQSHFSTPTASDGNNGVARVYKSQVADQAGEFFLPFRCFCTRKNIKCDEVMLEEMDAAKGLCDYVKQNLVEILVVGAPSRNSFVRRFRSTADVPSSVSKAAPEFCTVYVINKGKVSSLRAASRPVPVRVTRNQLQNQSKAVENPVNARPTQNSSSRANERSPFKYRNMTEDVEPKSPFLRNKAPRSHGEFSGLDSDISFVSSSRPSTDRMFPSFLDSQDMGVAPRLSASSDANNRNFGSPFAGSRSPDPNSMYGFSPHSQDNSSMSWSSQNVDDVEAEMRRLKQELKQTMDMYSSACREAITAKQRAMELHHWKIEEQQRFEQARLAEEAALAIAEREKAKSKAAIEAAEAAQRIAELEAKKRMNAEMKALKESEEKKKVLDALAQNDIRYRKYSIDEIEAATQNFAESRKIGEGGYGPVYRCYLDHTLVAVKVLRPDAAQGRSQFQQEVEVLSCIRHPNMVLLLGACPEYGCLVYEYMANGSLEDRLFPRGKKHVLPWQIRFRIAAEICTGLLFLHQTKPEPLVHRDLKPGNILLDRNFVSKISDVGLARLVPPSIVDCVTQYRMTATAGTFCYIDPEYQQTGMLGTKSDIYSLGIMLLQILTAKPPMGLTHHVERAIEKGTFAEFLDQKVPDWPVEEALSMAKLALKCSELRKKDRPDLGTVILPELNRLRAVAEQNMPNFMMLAGSPGNSPHQTPLSSFSQDNTGDSQLRHSGYKSSGNHSNTSSYTPQRRSNMDY